MIKHFVIAVVAVSTALMAHPGDAQARAQLGSEPQTAVAAASWLSESGTASYYRSSYNGRRSADGSRFSQKAMTAAHAWLPFDTKVRVTVASTGRTIIVTITDRLHSRHRVVDLSLASARQLGIVHQGLAEVTLIPG